MNRSTKTLAALVLVVASGSLFAQGSTRAVPKEFIHVRTLGRALSEFNDDRIQVAAAYYYSQDNHDSRWLLIELGALGQQTTKINRDQIELVTPTGRIVPLATQASGGAEAEPMPLLLQQAAPSRHPVESHFKATNGRRRLRFFTRPPGAGTVLDFVDLAPHELVTGDLLFESPTRLWDKGTYALVVKYDGAEAVLPIELR